MAVLLIWPEWSSFGQYLHFLAMHFLFADRDRKVSLLAGALGILAWTRRSLRFLFLLEPKMILLE